MPDFNVKNLIHYFENRLLEMDHNTLINSMGKGPEFPTLLVFIGEEAIRGFLPVVSGLAEVWPPYRQELRFIGITDTNNSVKYSKLSIKDNEISILELGKDEIVDIVAFLSSDETHFPNKNRLSVYFILSTASCNGNEDFLAGLKTMNEVKKALHVDEGDMLTALFVLLDESLTKRSIARQIRNTLSIYYDNPALYNNCNGIFLLSNRRSDNAVLRDWGICYSIIASIIELSNNRDGRISEKLFSGRILTAKYAREEKPSSKIAQVVVTKLIDEMSDAFASSNINLLNDETLLSQRLGITREGTLIIPDKFVEDTVIPRLPKESQLILFPRKDINKIEDIDTLSSGEFNNLTMDAWNSYLSKITDEAKGIINSEQRQNWSREYSKYLHNNFTIRELIYLNDNLESIRKLFTSDTAVSQSLDVLTYAKAMLKHYFSSYTDVVEIFISVIRREADRAKEILQNWNLFLQSKQNLFGINDDNLSEFYETEVRSYLDYNRNRLINELRNAKDIDSLSLFFEKILDDIISKNDIFLDTFENELSRRINRETLEADVGRYIRGRLMGSGAFTYLQVSFALSAPVLSSIMLKFGTLLYQSFRDSLDKEIYYYDTGYGNAAESIDLYEVDRGNLIS